MEREFTLKPIDSLKSLHNAVVDGLVIETITVGCKGSKAGVEQEGYWIPDKEQVPTNSKIISIFTTFLKILFNFIIFEMCIG